MIHSSSNYTNLLDWMYRVPKIANIFSIESSFAAWVRIEVALAECHFELEMIPKSAFEEIVRLKNLKVEDLNELRTPSINVGYPIIGLLEIMNQQLPDSARGFLHIGATTQDIMDTAVAMQIQESGKIITNSLRRTGDVLAELIKEHADTAMPGRTHGMHAVPITLGMKFAVYLSELLRHHERISRAVSEASCLSFFGAGGTSAASGQNAAQIRVKLANKLNLAEISIPWHASRDRFLEFILQCSSLDATLTRFAQEIIDLSRSEIEELSEPGGRHKGASSTMPQKRNPVMSEAIIGLAQSAVYNAQMMLRACEVNHERAAGEWQIEWKAIPETITSTASAIDLTEQMLSGLEIHEQNMSRNLDFAQGLILAEAYMIELAKNLGREDAHDLIYTACRLSEQESINLPDALLRIRPDLPALFEKWPIEAQDYLGDAAQICQLAIQDWQSSFQNL